METERDFSHETLTLKGMLGGGNKYYYLHLKCRKYMAVINCRISIIYTIMS